ncbi:16S rRNA (cytosine(1402)-N(4))-methyltransferase RsmH [Maledivibacter halophilus]|uniref:Ribosomal RNA small subunit methyltransferase H n=1 Tax=Maledivibacter halophilus TaxID=36842 RepID=A0A1T5LSA5_9FIRM|nr:16S rRNA (cytosine(1402)-N(4))-methyltransferase RsmH [Maledivibacter halophilus]SKC78866.1 16S rRNA (cytosine1402-N4)-methyltransferase [Maledivibacter halophilus]
MDFKHETVLLNEAVNNLNINPKGIYVDGTLGGGGHSELICSKLDEDGLLIGIDQDKEALEFSKKRLSKFSNKIEFVNDNFANIKNILGRLNIDKINGVVLDLGVSSYQLDEGERGFSYMKDAELDMRMDRRNELTAKHVVNNYSQDELFKIIKIYGEERWALRIAKLIVNQRKEKEIETTGELVDIIKKAIPASSRRTGPHPAKRTFQAIRIEVNNELGILENTVNDIADVLEIKGRMSIITFHSLEDRIIKNAYRELGKGCICPPEFPICKCDKKPSVKIITRKPIYPSDIEINKNPRARSAKLRVAEKI